MFTQALADQQAGRVETALDEFRQVAQVRDTAQVEYRIAACLEALGQRRHALLAYDRAVHLGRGDPQAKDVVGSANERISALAAEMGKLGVVVHGGEQADVRVDGEAFGPEERGSIVLEPGTHAVDVTAPQMKPAHATVSIEQGKNLQLTIDLVAVPLPPPPPPPPPPSHLRRDFGIGLVAAGAAAGIGAGILLVVRAMDIDSIHGTCPTSDSSGNLVCPSSSHDQVEGWRATASAVELPAAVLSGLAIAAALTGVVLVVTEPKSHATVGFAPQAGGGAFFVGGSF